MALESLRQVVATDYRGPRAVFTQVHVLKAVLEIGGSHRVGRARLGALTGLGQGEVRTLIKRLKDNDLIVIETGGCRLSRKGEKEYLKVRSVLSWSSRVNAEPLGLGRSCWAVVVRHATQRIRLGIEQRDAAIKAGADGAFTAVFRDGKFVVPGEGIDCEKGGPSEPWVTVRNSPVSEGDVVVITGSTAEVDAQNGALAAFLTLV